MKLICKKESTFTVETYSIKEVLEDYEEWNHELEETDTVVTISDKYIDIPRIDTNSDLIEDYYVCMQKAYFSKVGNDYGLTLLTDNNDTLRYYDEDNDIYGLTDLNLQVIKSLEELVGYIRVVFEKCGNSEVDLDVETLCLYYRLFAIGKECERTNNISNCIVLETLKRMSFEYRDCYSMVKSYLEI